MKDKYRAAGVDIEAGEAAVERIKTLVNANQHPNILQGIGGFGGLYELPISGMKRPVMVSSIDGVGTKLKVAFMMNQHHTIGQDLVNHCINDILVQGARPLFFLDYIGTGHLNPEVISEIVEGITISCRAYQCALLGGETAEMPGFYQNNEYDIAGCIVGLVDYDQVITGQKICPGNVMLGLPSNGLHTNGYSLARRALFEEAGLEIDTPIPEYSQTLGKILLTPHRCYLPEIEPILSKGWINGMAHITGGGFIGNIKRILPANVSAHVQTRNWNPPPIFNLIQKSGSISQAEMYDVFNMGIGMVIVADTNHADLIQQELPESVLIGRIESGNKQVINHY